MMKIVGIVFLILILNACTANEQNKTKTSTYFDVKGYFEREASRLNGLNLKIDKSVEINSDVERKRVHIKDFKNELSTFISADINKSSWKGSFSVKKDPSTERYSTINEKIPVKMVEVHYQNQKIRWIQIVSVTNNILYHSSDTLNYFPDSLYEIKKTQKIKLLNRKVYVVVGKLISSS